MKTIREYCGSEICELIKQALGTRRKGFKPVCVKRVDLKGDDKGEIVAIVEVEDLPRAKEDEADE